MKKTFWLTSLAIACCCAGRAQQGHAMPDSAMGQPSALAVGRNAVLTNFSATVKELNKVWLQWDVDSAEDGDYLVIERGTDGSRYETIGALRKSGSQTHY
jgi:hypothetical protein